MTEGVPENRRRWRQEAPGTLMSTLAAAHLTSSSFSASEGELGMQFIFKNITRPLGDFVRDLEMQKGYKNTLGLVRGLGRSQPRQKPICCVQACSKCH